MKPVNSFRSVHHAFTLIEVLVVITIIVILAGLVLRAAGIARTRSEVARCKAEMMALQSAVDQYYKDTGGVPTNSSHFYSSLVGGAGPGGKRYIDWPANRIAPGAFLDPWGRYYEYGSAHPDSAGAVTDVLGLGRVLFTLKSYGPDGVVNTSDDITLNDLPSNAN
jgi:general secretion pathway protein G